MMYWRTTLLFTTMHHFRVDSRNESDSFYDCRSHQTAVLLTFGRIVTLMHLVPSRCVGDNIPSSTTSDARQSRGMGVVYS